MEKVLTVLTLLALLALLLLYGLKLFPGDIALFLALLIGLPAAALVRALKE